jgi:c-di-GMP-binding flagellar brake protein YcgR
MKFNFNFDYEDIKYVKISYKDNFGENHFVKAGIKDVTEREITVCSKFEDGLEIETPQDISFNIICKDGMYKTKTTLKSIENDEPYTFFFLTAPQGFEYHQDREYFRVTLKMNCSYLVRQDGELLKIDAETVDLSANGICIRTPVLRVTEKDAYVSLKLGVKNIEAKVRYVRSEKVNNSYLMSFAFVNLAESDRDLISQTCIKKQLEQRRSSLF